MDQETNVFKVHYGRAFVKTLTSADEARMNANIRAKMKECFPKGYGKIFLNYV